MSAERERFEAWILSKAPLIGLERWPDNERYVYSNVDAAWDAWQARGEEDTRGWKATHIKTGLEYTVTGEAINATNAQDGQSMVVYERGGRVFVREAGEFTDKFAAVGATSHHVPEFLRRTDAPATASYPCGSLGEQIETEGGAS